MGLRVVHIINGDCEIQLHRNRHNVVKLRISEAQSDDTPSVEPADFEIEGNLPALQELFSTLSTALCHVDTLTGEMN